MKKWRVVRILPASVVFQHEEFREVLSEHRSRLVAWLACYLWHYSHYLPCKIEEIEVK